MNTSHLLLARALAPRPDLTDAEHDTLLAHGRGDYAALLKVGAVAAETAMQIVVRLLAVTDGPRDLARENVLVAQRLAELPVDAVLRGFDVLAKRRVNNQRTAGVIRSYLLGLPTLEALAVRKRATLRRLLTHALGRRGVATCLAFLALPTKTRTPHQERYLRKNLLRYGRPAVVADVLRFLFGKLEAVHRSDSPLAKFLAAKRDLSAGQGLPFATLRGIASTYHRDAPKYLVPRLAASRVVKRAVHADAAPVDTPLVAAMKHFLDVRTPEAWARAQSEATKAAEPLPRLPLRVAVVLDASASMLGTGHRLHHAHAIAGAVIELARRTAPAVDVVTLAGSEAELGLPFPEGETNLALALVEAARTGADAVVVLSDGYENQQVTDTAAVVETLARLDDAKPVVHVVPAFTVRENLAGRLALGSAPALLETGEHGFEALWLRLVAALRPEALHGVLEAMS